MTFLSKTNYVQPAANIATLLFAVVMLLQLLIATGIVPISIAWGGRQTELTPSLRIASFVAVALLGAFIYIIRYRAGLAGSVPIPVFIKVTSWIVTAFMAFNTLGNLASLSNVEKILFSPITFALTIATFIVSASRLEL